MKKNLSFQITVFLLVAVTNIIPSIVYAGFNIWTEYTTSANQQIHALAIDPNNHNIIYTGAYAGIYKSTDYGNTWACMTSGIAFNGVYRDFYSIVIDPTNSSKIYAGCVNGGIYRSTDGANSWTIITTGMGFNSYIGSLAINPTNPNILYASYPSSNSYGGVYKSTDSGNTWALTSTMPYIYPVTVDPNNPNTIFAGSSYAGIYKSMDGGNTWSRGTVGYIPSSWAYCITVDSTNSNNIYVGSDNLVYRSTDGGNTWAYTTLSGINSVYGIIIDPYNHNKLFAGGFGVQTSYNAGVNWTGLPYQAGFSGSGYLALLYLSPGLPTLYDGGIGLWSYTIRPTSVQSKYWFDLP